MDAGGGARGRFGDARRRKEEEEVVASLIVDVIDDDDEEREAFNLFASLISNTFLRERGYTSGGSRSPALFENRCCCRVTTAMVV